MAVHLLQVTLGAGKTQISTSALPCRAVTFQNNAAAVMRIGDTNVTTTKGIQLAANGAANSSYSLPPIDVQDYIDLSQWYVIGTAAQLLDVLYLD